MKKDNSIPRYDITVYTSANKDKTGLTNSTSNILTYSPITDDIFGTNMYNCNITDK